MEVAMLSTIDNPHDPFDNYDEWFAFDDRSGYHSISLLARVVVSSDEISDTDQQLAINEAIDEIVKENVSGRFIKVTREINL